MTKMPIVFALLATRLAAADGKPGPELVEMARSMTGVWKCDGTAAGAKVKVTVSTKADLDGFWIHDTITGPKLKIEAFTTFDPATHKWRRLAVASDGGQMAGTGEPMKDMKMDFVLDATTPAGAAMVREHLDMSDLRKGAHVWSELSMDKGQTWQVAYDLTCRR